MESEKLREHWFNSLKEVKEAKGREKKRKIQIDYDIMIAEDEDHLSWYYGDDWIYATICQ